MWSSGRWIWREKAPLWNRHPACPSDRETYGHTTKGLSTNRLCPSAYMVSKASEDFPLPESPVKTTSSSRGMVYIYIFQIVYAYSARRQVFWHFTLRINKARRSRGRPYKFCFGFCISRLAARISRNCTQARHSLPAFLLCLLCALRREYHTSRSRAGSVKRSTRPGAKISPYPPGRGREL